MLQHIHIQNFTIIHHLELDLQAGLTALTGETGAGKSIIVDALELVLGGRADSSLIRHGCDRCEISTTFNLERLPEAQQWLANHEIECEDHTLILRRTLTQDGRSRAYIQGQPSPLQLLKDLGNLLVNIHGQHEHQSLMKRDAQRQLLDTPYPELVNTVKTHYQTWHQAHNSLEALRVQDHTARCELLRYQVRELDTLGLTEGELAALESEHTQLAHASQLLSDGHSALDILADNTALNKACQLLSSIQAIDTRITPTAELTNSALIQIQEAETELRQYLETLDINPERLAFVTQRLETIYDLARKHRIVPENLSKRHIELSTELQQLEHAEEHLVALEETLKTALKDYHATAKKLTSQRQKTAQVFSAQITEAMQTLGMPGGKFGIHFETHNTQQPSPCGAEKIEFQVSANPGQPLQALSKVASGGELSRISLAIQVMAAQSDTTPTLIFDEVDVGIGGGTAEIVGNLLRKLGSTSQVLCVTHLPQVASKSHHHLQVQKQAVDGNTITQIQVLTSDEKVQEIARMLGGLTITKQTLAHAREMIEPT
jgi:DNA repair protein RecN (Recombination protein N)